MAFQVSPGVNISEIDLTTVVPAVTTTQGAIAGVFRWGPVDERILVTSENELANRFGKPASYYTEAGNTSSAIWNNYETFFSAANFLAYSDALYVVRVAENANTAGGSVFDAKYQGVLGDSLQVAYCDSSSFAATTVSDSISIVAFSNQAEIGSNTVNYEVGDYIVVDNQNLKVTAIAVDGANTTVTFENKYIAASNLSAASYAYQWGYNTLFDSAPESGKVHVVVIDEDGAISGVAGTILEKFTNVSKTISARNEDGSTNYLFDVLDQNSSFIAITEANVSSVTGNGYDSLSGGLDGEDEDGVATGTLAVGYDLFKSAEDVDISLVILGRPNTALTNYVLSNVVEYRRDCVAFASPFLANVGSVSATAQNIVDAFSTINSSSYIVFDSGYKYQYDKYSDVYRWIPLNGDIAGLCAYTDDVRDPWFSPAGYNRGLIKNAIKLLLNPNKTQRDLLYKNRINPVITQPGQGTLLFGDKTGLSLPSAFDRINVRRLFIVLEKVIANAAKGALFEFNDEFTRAQFVNLVEPFLRDVQGRRGIFDFRVICDETNNTAEVIDRNEFVGDIYIKPARSINFIQLNFVAVRSGVEFSEIVGAA